MDNIVDIYIPQIASEYIFRHMLRKHCSKYPLTKEDEIKAVQIIQEGLEKLDRND